MQRQKEFECPNCGLTWTDTQHHARQAGGGAFIARCPVCNYRIDTGATPRAPHLSAADLETRLHGLVDQARQSDVPMEDILRVLGDELAYISEFAHPNHHFLVEVIDLGARDERYMSSEHADQMEFEHRRTLRGQTDR